MEKVNLHSRAEMKKVMGGIISRDIWLQMCYQGKFGRREVLGDGSVQDEINRLVCESMYEEMI
jgi:hypothetical protein